MFSFQRMFSISRKEVLHMLRDSQTFFFTIFFPVAELFLVGYAIDTNVRDIRTIIVDHAGTQESRELLQRFENSKDFLIVAQGFSDEDASRAIVAGTARVGIIVPRDYSQKLEAGQTAQILVLVDGSMSAVAAEAVNVSNALALRESLQHALGDRQLPVEARPRVLFNPDTRSPNFFIPGLMVILCQMMATILSATAIVREKEQGTLEQLYMTPVRREELILGKMLPYVALTLAEFCFIALLMRVVFQVEVNGPFLTLLAMTIPFIFTMLGFGLLISTKAQSRDAATQMAMGTILPAIFLSGYVFSLDSLPAPLLLVARCIPATWLIDASRGVILRGASWSDLWLNAVVLWAMALVMLFAASMKLRKQLS
jgi:ABC-2 type transport system permease protein